MRNISYDELTKCLNEIAACDAFELHMQKRNNAKTDYYIPYMMNDALECYLLLQNAHMTGEYMAEMKEEIQVEFVNAENEPALIFRQGTLNVFTIWFQEAFQDLQCYRYDQIGHFWVSGQEHWRRLVYMIGTMHDKYNYMGEVVCNEQEMELLPLMEFAPFRYFSPIHESLDEYYVNSKDGLHCMKRLAAEAGDRKMELLLKCYGIPCLRNLLNRWIINRMSTLGGCVLYQCLFEKVKSASESYPARTYGKKIEILVAEKRKKAEECLISMGFSGEYPLFQKGNMQILAMEEHPFTVLESDCYDFKIQYMVSEISGNRGCWKRGKKTDHMLNVGFFRKKGNRGWIARDFSELQKKL